jgi:hypothetical protein
MGTYFTITDASGSPKTSPVALASAATGLSITPPIGAIAMQIYSTINATIASDVSATSAHGYLMLSTTPYRFPVKGGVAVSVAASATAAGTINFAFEMLNSANRFASADA